MRWVLAILGGFGVLVATSGRAAAAHPEDEVCLEAAQDREMVRVDLPPAATHLVDEALALCEPAPRARPPDAVARIAQAATALRLARLGLGRPGPRRGAPDAVAGGDPAGGAPLPTPRHRPTREARAVLTDLDVGGPPPAIRLPFRAGPAGEARPGWARRIERPPRA